MAQELIDVGTVSSRGQIAIPAGMRKELALEDGQKVLFFVEGDTIMIKKITQQTFAEITRPLKVAAQASGLKESDVPDLVHRFRKSKK